MYKPMLKAALLVAFTVVVVVLASSQQGAAQNPHPGSAPVNIVGPLPLPVTGDLGVTGTVSVRDVDKIVQTPFQARLVFGTPLTVDSGKQLTIEFVTSLCDLDNTLLTSTEIALNTTVGGNRQPHHFSPKFSRNFNSSGINRNFFISTDLTRIYADSGTTVSLTEVGGFSCSVTISGYYTDTN